MPTKIILDDNDYSIPKVVHKHAQFAQEKSLQQVLAQGLLKVGRHGNRLSLEIYNSNLDIYLQKGAKTERC